jgi:hypothetical protein
VFGLPDGITVEPVAPPEAKRGRGRPPKSGSAGGGGGGRGGHRPIVVWPNGQVQEDAPLPDHLVPGQHVPSNGHPPTLAFKRRRGRKPRHVKEAMEAAMAAGADRKSAAEWAELQRDGPQAEEAAVAAAAAAVVASASRTTPLCPFCSTPVAGVKEFRQHLNMVHKRW